MISLRSVSSASFRTGAGRCFARSLALGVVLLLGLATAAPAQEMTATRKLGRGLAGMTMGILELPGNMTQEWRNDGPLSGLTVGFVMGIVKVPARTLVGVYELLSCPFPLPAGYEPLLTPEYPWQYFQAEPGEVYGFSDRYLSAELAELRQIPGAEVERTGGAVIVRFPGDLLFSTGSSTLNAEARARLRSVAETITQHPGTRIQIQGFADSTGSEKFNLPLSVARAEAVSRYLVEQGVDANRIDTAGYGATRAIASNDTPEGRRLNRRVEIQIRAGGVAAAR
ncbi:MAG: exosortase system-associated protein, TIGR04073 family [Deltaproteobacteria bacterium]|nr:exosortase system-associated protein, TIGR04073 family [Deltaproteobacteria bacterium]